MTAIMIGAKTIGAQPVRKNNALRVQKIKTAMLFLCLEETAELNSWNRKEWVVSDTIQAEKINGPRKTDHHSNKTITVYRAEKRTSMASSKALT
jgi:hypothetical protein